MLPIRRFLEDERGATTIEYTLIAFVISVGIGLATTSSNSKALLDIVFTSFSEAIYGAIS